MVLKVRTQLLHWKNLTCLLSYLTLFILEEWMVPLEKI